MSIVSVIIAILVFGVLVLVHEFGHYIIAKKNGIGVLEFSIGMGKKLISTTKNGTLYSLRLLPIGGFCKLKGEDDEITKAVDDSYATKSVFQRICVVVAGAIFNLIFAAFLIFIVALFTGYSTVNIKEFSASTHAQEAGLQEGDIITKINGHKINTYEDLSFNLYWIKDNSPLEVTVLRNVNNTKQSITYSVIPTLSEVTNTYLIGVRLEIKDGVYSTDGQNKAKMLETLQASVNKTVSYASITISQFAHMFAGDVGFKDFSGVVGIVGYIGDTYTETIKISLSAAILSILSFAAMLSVNLGVINLMPFPALDGGRLVFLLIESIRRKPIAIKIENIIHVSGFAILMIFAAVVFINDILKIINVI